MERDDLIVLGSGSAARDAAAKATQVCGPRSRSSRTPQPKWVGDPQGAGFDTFEIGGIGEIDWIDHVSALELTKLPESLLVVGGGPVAVEFAQIFARSPSLKRVVQMPSPADPKACRT